MSVVTKEEIETKSIPEPNSGCWIWLGAVSDKGYGTIGIHGKNRKAHRIAYEEFCGPIPSGMLVRHSCDNPACVNPDHLSVGTDMDNNADMRVRGRAVYVNGNRVATSKLSPRDVDEIRSLYPLMTRAQIARRFGVTWAAVNFILCGRNWRHHKSAQFEAEREGK